MHSLRTYHISYVLLEVPFLLLLLFMGLFAFIKIWQNWKIKGILHPKTKICHHLLTLKLLQTCVYFFYRTQKQDILKNDCNFGTIDFHSIFFSTMEVSGAKQPFVSNCSSKYLPLCSVEERNTGLQQLEGK